MFCQDAGRRKVATRVVHSLLVGVLAAMSALLIAFSSTVAAAVQLLAYTPIIMTGTFTADPDSAYVAMAMDDFILPSRNAAHPPVSPDYYTPVALDTPEQAWPITGLFDHTFGQSVQIGWDDLQQQIATTTVDTDGQPIIVFGYSQSAVISTHEKRRLAELYPVGQPGAPDIQFVLIGDLNRPNGGVMTRFQGGYLPLINFYFDGPAPTDTNFATVDIARQYDGFADFPLYPVNVVADLNALLGMLYVHTDYQAVSLDPDSPDYVEGTVTQQYGDTTYYTIPTARLPLLQPLRDLGVPEPLMALVEPALRVVIETGYDRTINPGLPTPGRLIPRVDPVRFVEDFVAAVGQGITDAVDEIENPTARPAGPTPTERVLTDLVRANLEHTLAGRPAASATEAEVTTTEVTTTEATETEVTKTEVTKDVPRSSWSRSERTSSASNRTGSSAAGDDDRDSPDEDTARDTADEDAAHDTEGSAEQAPAATEESPNEPTSDADTDGGSSPDSGDSGGDD